MKFYLRRAHNREAVAQVATQSLVARLPDGRRNLYYPGLARIPTPSVAGLLLHASVWGIAGLALNIARPPPRLKRQRALERALGLEHELFTEESELSLVPSSWSRLLHKPCGRCNCHLAVQPAPLWQTLGWCRAWI